MTLWRVRISLISGLVLVASGSGLAFDEAVDTAGPLTVRIQEPMLGAYGSGGILRITQSEMPVPIVVQLSNAGALPVQGRLRLQVIDLWRIEPPAARAFSVTAHGTAELEFTVYPGTGTFNAHYPVHAWAEFEWEGRRLTAHPILILPTEFYNPPRPELSLPGILEIPQRGSVALWRVPVHRESSMASSRPQPGATGTEYHSMAPVVRYGERVEWSPRQSIRMTLGPRPPSQREMVESAFTEFPLALPESNRLLLSFATARDRESDQVSFKVLARPLDPAHSAATQVLWTGTGPVRRWQDHSIDLTPLAGRRIRLVLAAALSGGEGSGRAYWGEPTLIAGAGEAPADFPPPAQAEFRTLGRAGDFEVRVWPGRRGLLDAAVGFLGDGRQLLFWGFQVGVLDDSLNDWRSVAELAEVGDESDANRYRLRHRFRSWAGSFDLLGEMWTEQGALRVAFRLENVPAPSPWLDVHLESIKAGSWSETADRIYAAVGSVIQQPQAFRMSFDGHHLATSFVGFDFANGLSIVQGVDVPPTALEVDPSARLYSLDSPHAQTLTFIPADSVWAGVRRWREINGLRPAGGVTGLAGRFVFDLWAFGTRYREAAERLAKAFRYGLTDSAVIWHNWQRWGYDYRLPDIWPPNPDGGTLEEFRAVADLCRENGVLFAPHDNYIDFYPDAEGFSYDHIVFRRDGTPYRAWFMSARKAQSYRWRPDRLLPFLQRNVRLIQEGLAPTAYFIDVWSSIGPHDYWTSDGRFHDRVSTRRAWGEAFAWIREFLGGNAPQISEAGHDQLIGWLDGAQANHLRIGSEAHPFVIRVECRDSERIPWFDAAHHDRFVLHGAGYPGRYEGGLDESEHGIYSDDYITTEVLTGHPAMVDTGFSRDAVRKYWLLSELMRALALQRIEDVIFEEGDLHRQHVRWERGEVWVNRGQKDWPVGEKLLPPYGFYSRVGEVEAGIEIRDGRRVEWSRAPGRLYLNGRGAEATAGGVTSAGGLLLVQEAGRMLLTPLPEGDRFPVRIDWSALAGDLPVPDEVQVLDEDGTVRSRGRLRPAGGRIEIVCEPGVFRYRFR
jgi:hypothetical protein